MGPLLNLFQILSPYYEYHNISRKGGLNSPLNCFWYVYGALLQQGKQLQIILNFHICESVVYNGVCTGRISYNLKYNEV